jgi:hypothetical protein
MIKRTVFLAVFFTRPPKEGVEVSIFADLLQDNNPTEDYSKCWREKNSSDKIATKSC